jgi:hypothetical protein
VFGINNVVVELIEILKRSVFAVVFFFEFLFLKGKENIKNNKI